MSRAHIDLVRELLDHELIDVDGVPCGVVDDVELSGGDGIPTEVAALLVGPGAWVPRLPRLLALVLTRVLGREVTRIPLSEVHRISEHIVLKQPAAALGLGKIDRRVGRWLERIPGNEKAH